MAEIPAVYKQCLSGVSGTTTSAPNAFVVEWLGVSTATSDTCQAVYHPDFPDMSFEVELPTPGTTPVASCQGGNDLAATTPKTLNDLTGTAIALTAAGCVGVLENTAYNKPKLTGTTVVANIRMLFKK